MKRQDYFPIRLGDRIVWLKNYRNKLSGHATALSLAAPDVTAQLLDADNAVYALEGYRGGVDGFTQSAYALIEDALYDDTNTDNIAWAAFALPAGAPAAAAHGCLRRIFAYIADVIKKSGGYTLPIGEDLGTEGAVIAPPNPATTTPDFDMRKTTGGKLEVVWDKAEFDGVKLQFDLGTAGTQSDVDLRPNYTLNWLPPAGTSAIIKVRACYIYKGEDFGNWSNWEPFTLTN